MSVLVLTDLWPLIVELVGGMPPIKNPPRLKVIW